MFMAHEQGVSRRARYPSQYQITALKAHYSANRLYVGRMAMRRLAKRTPEHQRAQPRQRRAEQKQALIAKRRDDVAAAEGHRSEAESGGHLRQPGDGCALRRRNQLQEVDNRRRVADP